MAATVRTITVSLDTSKTFDRINIHTLIRKLLQTRIPGTIIKFIANHIKGRKAYTTYINHTSSPRQFKTCVTQRGVLSSTLLTFTLQTHHHQEHQFRSWPVQMTSLSHLHRQARVKPRNIYNHTWTKQNNLTLNPDKTIYTLFTPDPAEYKSNLDVNISHFN